MSANPWDLLGNGLSLAQPFVKDLDDLAYGVDKLLGFPDTKLIELFQPNNSLFSWAQASTLFEIERQEKELITQEELIRVWDKDMRKMIPVGDILSNQFEYLQKEPGQAEWVIPLNHWVSDHILNNVHPYEDLNVTIDPYRSRRSWRSRWGGKITTVTEGMYSGGKRTLTLQCVHNMQHLKHLHLPPNALLPPEVQYPRGFEFIFPVQTMGLTLLGIILAREFFPGINILAAGLDPGAVFGTDVGNISPLNWPLQPCLRNPFTDQTMPAPITSRYNDLFSVMKTGLTDAGAHWKAYTWLLEDEDSPHELLDQVRQIAHTAITWSGAIVNMLGDLAGRAFGALTDKATEQFGEFEAFGFTGEMLINDTKGVVGMVGNAGKMFLDGAEEVGHTVVQILGRPWRNCVIFDIQDNSGVQGPTGTILDSPLRLAAVTADDNITSAIEDFTGTGDPNNDPDFFQNLLGVAPKPPNIFIRDSDETLLVEFTRTIHKILAKSVIVGNYSPQILNDLIRQGIKFGLNRISEMLYSPEYGSTGTYQQPISNGLDNLYQDQLSNVFFAYRQWTAIERVFQSGAFGFRSIFEQGDGTAYTPTGFLATRAGLYKSRPYVSSKSTAAVQFAYIPLIDFDIGERIRVESRKVMFDYEVSALKFNTTEKGREFTMAFGDDGAEEDGLAKAIRFAASAVNMVGLFVGGESGGR